MMTNDRWFAHYERALSEREFAKHPPKKAEQLAVEDANRLYAEDRADEADYFRRMEKEAWIK